MRGLGLLALVVGCYAPSVPSNVPCDPAASRCPAGQMCFASADGFVCAEHDPGVPMDDAPQLTIDAAPPDAPPNTVTKTYMAKIAECIAPSLPSPTFCRMSNGNEQLVIDIKDTMTNDPWHSFLAFEIDSALAGKTITKVTLRLVATNDGKAPGPDSGTVFKVQPFTLSSLMMTAPAKVGAQLAGTQGAVVLNGAKNWVLPTSLVTPGQAVYLGLYPNNDDGVNYWNTDGTTPPRLIVEAQ